MAGARDIPTVGDVPSLLERAEHLRELQGYLDAAARGQGSLVLLGGSAGVGKTSLVRAFRQAAAARATVLMGACDALSTPQPLAPLMDVAAMLGGQAGREIEEAATRHERFRAFLRWLSAAQRPNLVVFEDVHWADEATLDLLRFLGRRIEATRALLVVTFRSDETGPGHPLRAVFGDLASLGTTRRIELAPLSLEAVATLAAGSEQDPVELHRLTGGNPFFVTEVLAGHETGIPTTVRDAVLARASRLSPAGRSALDAAAIVGSPGEFELLAELLGEPDVRIDPAITAGMLEPADQRSFQFRHEIARQAILEAMAPGYRTALHARVLEILERAADNPALLARLAHHAEESGHKDAVLRYAPEAARHAITLGAHREACAQLRRALRFAAGIAPEQRAGLLEQYAQETYLTDQLEESIESLQRALAIWRAGGERLREGENLYRTARVLVLAGRNAEAEMASLEAIEILEALPESPKLAAAYQIQAHLRMLNRDNAEAIERGMRAIELAERLGAEEALIYAHNSVGSAMLLSDVSAGLDYLERSVKMAREAGLDDYVGAAYGNLGSGSGEMYRFAQADHYLTQGIAFAVEHDLDFESNYMLAWQSLSHLYQGRWGAASEIAANLLRLPNLAAVSRIMALVAIGRVRARRGDPDVMAALDEALEAARQTATLQRLAPVHAARAEAAWLAGDSERTVAEARAAYALARSQRHVWFTGELAYWQWKADKLDAVPEFVAEPFALQIKGDWAAAAAAWEERDCPYEAARALAESDDEDALRQALETFDRLGAAPARGATAQHMRELGVASIPRGARPSTQANPAGLTNRQVEVARLLAGGCANADIAERLFISPKTVEHHISAIFAKLDVDNRVDAARAVERLGLGAAE